MANFDKNKTKIVLCSRSSSADHKDFTWGSENYSYRIVLDRFYDFFKRSGFDVGIVEDSRIYHHKVSLSKFGSKNLIHIAFQSPDEARVMPNAYNICSFAWEFDSMPNKKFLKNLERFDELWPTSFQAYNFLKKFLKDKTKLVKKVQIPLSDFYLKNDKPFSFNRTFKDVEIFNLNPAETLVPMVSNLKESGYIFSIFNPWDGRKDFKSMIEIFLDNRNKSPEILLLKLSIDNKPTGTKWNNIYDILEKHYEVSNLNKIAKNIKVKNSKNTNIKKSRSNNKGTKNIVRNKKKIFLITEKLSDKQLYSIYKHSKFVWYTSKCEGTNLPVVEAILSGSNVITPVHSGLNDYLKSSYPLKIDSELTFMSQHWIQEYNFELIDGDRPPTWFKVKSKSNFDLLNNFDDYLDKLKQSETFSNVKNYFSDREIWSAIRK